MHMVSRHLPRPAPPRAPQHGEVGEGAKGWRGIVGAMGRDRLRVLVGGFAAIALILVGALAMDWFRLSFASEAGSGSLGVDLRHIRTCVAGVACVTVRLGPLPGMYPALAAVTMWSSLLVVAMVVFQGGMRVLTGNASEAITRLGYMVTLMALSIAVATAYIFGLDNEGPKIAAAVEAAGALRRAEGPLTLILGLMTALVALYWATASESSDPAAAYKPVTVPSADGRSRTPSMRIPFPEQSGLIQLPTDPASVEPQVPLRTRPMTEAPEPPDRTGSGTGRHLVSERPTTDLRRPATGAHKPGFTAVGTNPNQPAPLTARSQSPTGPQARSQSPTGPQARSPSPTGPQARSPSPTGPQSNLRTRSPTGAPTADGSTRNADAFDPASRTRIPTGLSKPIDPARTPTGAPSSTGDASHARTPTGSSNAIDPASRARTPTGAPLLADGAARTRTITGVMSAVEPEPQPRTRTMTGVVPVRAATAEPRNRTSTGMIPVQAGEATGMHAARTKSGPLPPVPPHLRNRLAYVAVTAELTSGGIDARREDGTSRLVLWRDVVGVVARRLPDVYDATTFIDVVSTAGSTLRIVPWTKLTGVPVADGEARPRGIVECVVERCPAARVDPATQYFLETGEAAQLPDLSTLKAHDERLA